MDEKSRQQKLQGILIEIENYKRRMDGLSRQTQLIESTMIELNSTAEVLDALSENKPGTPILVPLGSNSFVRAELKDTEKVIVGIGADISVEKSLADAKKSLEGRGEELKATMEKIQKAAAEINNRLIELNSEYERLIREMQKEQGYVQ